MPPGGSRASNSVGCGLPPSVLVAFPPPLPPLSVAVLSPGQVTAPVPLGASVETPPVLRLKVLAPVPAGFAGVVGDAVPGQPISVHLPLSAGKEWPRNLRLVSPPPCRTTKESLCGSHSGHAEVKGVSERRRVANWPSDDVLISRYAAQSEGIETGRKPAAGGQERI